MRKLFTIFLARRKNFTRGFSWEKCKGWLLFEDQFISSVVVIEGATRYWHKNRSLWGDINLTLPRKRAQSSNNSIPRCKFHHRFYSEPTQGERKNNNKEFEIFQLLRIFILSKLELFDKFSVRYRSYRV